MIKVLNRADANMQQFAADRNAVMANMSNKVRNQAFYVWFQKVKDNSESKTCATSATTDMISVDEAYAHCANVARRHYENFPVASVLVPLRMRKHLFAIYAFSRLADDIADEPWTTDTSARIAALDELEQKLVGSSDISEDPVFVALHQTIKEARLPLAPFLRLLTAFKSDVNFVTPTTWEDVLAYCSNSADPVGELFLRLDHNGREPSAEAIACSNAICTALQITNFLQDLGTDLQRGRSYLPHHRQ
ncbi:MAG: squalene/phytoene synthase family protein [Ignavibacteria bacterium]|nr:squalene/phytoene synthase family protein [Ignavibacteria bacterium]